MSDLFTFAFFNFQAFSVHELPLLSHLNIRGNPLDHNSVGELFEVLKLFPLLSSLEVKLSFHIWIQVEVTIQFICADMGSHDMSCL